jgi:hypothetical protein
VTTIIYGTEVESSRCSGYRTDFVRRTDPTVALGVLAARRLYPYYAVHHII